MIPETDRLLEQLSEFRQNRHAVGHQQPKFTAWVDAVRHWLRFRDDRDALQSFEQLRLARVTGGMWRRDEASGAEVREFLAELDQVEALLHAAARGGPAPGEPPEGSHPDGAKDSSGGGSQPQGAEARRDRGKEVTVKKEAEVEAKGQTKQPPASQGRLRAMEVLLGDLGEELRRPNGDLGRIQKTMSELLDLKKTGDLMERVLAGAGDPEARWEAVRAPLAQLWSVNREMVVDLLPTLLKKP